MQGCLRSNGLDNDGGSYFVNVLDNPASGIFETLESPLQSCLALPPYGL